MLLNLLHEAKRFEIRYHLLAGLISVESRVGRASALGHLPIVSDHGFERQIVLQSRLIIVRIVRGRELYNTRSECTINELISDYWNRTILNRKKNLATNN